MRPMFFLGGVQLALRVVRFSGHYLFGRVQLVLRANAMSVQMVKVMVHMFCFVCCGVLWWWVGAPHLFGDPSGHTLLVEGCSLL